MFCYLRGPGVIFCKYGPDNNIYSIYDSCLYQTYVVLLFGYNIILNIIILLSNQTIIILKYLLH